MKWICILLIVLFVPFEAVLGSTLYGEETFGEVSSLWSIDQSTGAATFLQRCRHNGLSERYATGLLSHLGNS